MIIFGVLGKAANEAEAFAAIYPHALDKSVPMAGPDRFKLPNCVELDMTRLALDWS